MAYLFTLAHKKNRVILGDLATKVCKDIIRAVHNKSCQKATYVGNGVVLTRIIYEALGMRERRKPVPAPTMNYKLKFAREGKLHKEKLEPGQHPQT